MEQVLFIFHLLLIGGLAYLMWRKDRDLFFWPALALKLLAGISVGLIYKYYYTTGDTWNFFRDAIKLTDAIKDNPQGLVGFFWSNDISAGGQVLAHYQSRSLYMVKWTAIFNLIDGNNYWLTSLYFSFVSFACMWVLYKTLRNNFPELRLEAAVALFFIPSIVFWGSGIIKESLAMAALCVMTTFFLRWTNNRSAMVFPLIASLFSLWILWSLKYYWAAMWLIAAVPFVVTELLSGRIVWIAQNKKLTWSLTLVLAISGVSLLHPNFNFNQVLDVIVSNHNAYTKISDPEEVIHYYDLQPHAFSIFINAPWALVSGVFRPFILEAGTVLQIAAAVENLILLILFAMTCFRLSKANINWNLLHLIAISYIVLLAIFLALSIPNFGSLSRFRVGFTPFLWFMLLSASGVLSRLKFLKLRRP
jgi:hypothetical protein